MLDLPETGEVLLFNNEDYKVSVALAVNSSYMPTAICSFGTEADVSLFKANMIDQSWLHNISHCNRLEIESSYNSKLKVSGPIIPRVGMGKVCTHVTFGLAEKLISSMLLEIMFISWFLKIMYLAKWKIVLY